MCVTDRRTVHVNGCSTVIQLGCWVICPVVCVTDGRTVHGNGCSTVIQLGPLHGERDIRGKSLLGHLSCPSCVE